MGRRNPNNPRYRKDSLGKTRKSAASAKPKRAAGDRASSSGKKKGAASEVTGWRKFFQPLPTPDTPEFRMWRKIWLALFIAGAVFTVTALLQRSSPSGNWILVAAYSCLIGAILIDVLKIRKMRREYADELARGSKGKKGGKKGSAAKGSEGKAGNKDSDTKKGAK